MSGGHGAAGSNPVTPTKQRTRSLVERQGSSKPSYAGSNPAGCAILLYNWWKVLTQGRLELVPAWSHKPNHGGSNPPPATNLKKFDGVCSSIGRVLDCESSQCRFDPGHTPQNKSQCSWGGLAIDWKSMDVGSLPTIGTKHNAWVADWGGAALTQQFQVGSIPTSGTK